MKLNGTTKASSMNNNTISQQQQLKSTSSVGDSNSFGADRVYFKQSEADARKLRCLLCSVEFCKELTSSAFLSDHLRLKHAIERDLTATTSDRSEAKPPGTNNVRRVTRSKHSPDSRGAETSATMTIHKHQRLKSNEGDCGGGGGARTGQKRVQANNGGKQDNHELGDLRRNLDLLEYDDLSKASLKPLPAASLSRNLFSRLNQLSEPVTRKLKFWNKKSFQVSSYDPCFKVIYLGNLGMQYWSKDESCLEKPLNTLWNNYLVNMKTEIVMRLTICNSGLKAITRQHGLTQYWSNRLVYCCSHKNYPKVFSWIYRHEGKKMRQELRCHAVFCSSPERASKMATLLNQRLACALQEFRREKKSRGAPSIVGKEGPLLTQQTLPRTIPLRRQILAKGSANFRPPLERSKSAPKLMSIREEDYEFEEEEEEDELGGYEEEEEGADEDTSHDEFEYEQSFGDKDEEDEESDLDELGEGKRDDDDTNDDADSAHKIDSNSLATTGNEETSNSSVYATGDISYDNIVMNKQHLATNQERLDCASTLTAPASTMSSSHFKRSSSSRKSTRMSQRQVQVRASLLRPKSEDSPPSPVNSIDVDLHEFGGGEEDEGDDHGGHLGPRDACEWSGQAANSHNLKQSSANNTLQQESTSSSNQSSVSRRRIKVDRAQAAQQVSISEQHASLTPQALAPKERSESDTTKSTIPDRPTPNISSTDPDQPERRATSEGNPKPPASSSPSIAQQRKGDGEDPATREIILSWSNNLSIK